MQINGGGARLCHQTPVVSCHTCDCPYLESNTVSIGNKMIVALDLWTCVGEGCMIQVSVFCVDDDHDDYFRADELWTSWAS